MRYSTELKHEHCVTYICPKGCIRKAYITGKDYYDVRKTFLASNKAKEILTIHVALI